jgi:hypothetical protein
LTGWRDEHFLWDSKEPVRIALADEQAGAWRVVDTIFGSSAQQSIV